MPMVNGRFYSAFGRYSASTELMITRSRMAAADPQVESDAAAIDGALTAVSDQMTQGLSTIAVQRATTRIRAAAVAKLVNLKA
jgi:hypothetical protein